MENKRYVVKRSGDLEEIDINKINKILSITFGGSLPTILNGLVTNIERYVVC